MWLVFVLFGECKKLWPPKITRFTVDCSDAVTNSDVCIFFPLPDAVNKQCQWKILCWPVVFKLWMYPSIQHRNEPLNRDCPDLTTCTKPLCHLFFADIRTFVSHTHFFVWHAIRLDDILPPYLSTVDPALAVTSIRPSPSLCSQLGVPKFLPIPTIH